MSKFPESALAHHYLDPLAVQGRGLEIGGSAHNPFGISNCLNVDITDDMETIYKLKEIELCGEALPVDIVSPGDSLPMFSDSSVEYIVNSHVFEHMPNPIACLMEWWRVVKHRGIIYSVIPHRDAAAADATRAVTTVGHIVSDWILGIDADTHEIESGHGKYGHYHVYTLEMYLELIEFVNELCVGMYRRGNWHAVRHGMPKMIHRPFKILQTMRRDDKVGNGAVIVHEVVK